MDIPTQPDDVPDFWKIPFEQVQLLAASLPTDIEVIYDPDFESIEVYWSGIFINIYQGEDIVQVDEDIATSWETRMPGFDIWIGEDERRLERQVPWTRALRSIGENILTWMLNDALGEIQATNFASAPVMAVDPNQPTELN